MPFAVNGGDAGKGIAFVIGAASMAEFVAKACSSPQTVEINAKKTIRPGITTEGATALYYAAQVLKIRKRTSQSEPYKLDLM